MWSSSPDVVVELMKFSKRDWHEETKIRRRMKEYSNIL